MHSTSSTPVSGPDDLEEGLAFAHDAASLAAMAMVNLTCAAGDFDSVFSPARAPSGFEELLASSVRVRVGEQDGAVDRLEDVLRPKEDVCREEDARGALVIRAYLRKQPA